MFGTGTPVTRKPSLGLALLGTIAAGVVTGLLLVAPNDSHQPEVAPPTSTSTGGPVSGAPADDGVVAAGQAIADAITEGDSLKFGLVTCDQQDAGELRKLQQKWNAAGPVVATVVRPPAVTGAQATVTIRVEGAGGARTTDFPLRRKGAKWCVPG